MNEENRKKVEDYLNSSKIYSLAPLIFEGYESNKEEFDPTKYSVEDMIERALELSKEYNSINSETDKFETYANRSRSSLDIWRHIKCYYLDITIFDVMNALYNLAVDKKLGGLFCPDISRRIFRLQRLEEKDCYDEYIEDSDVCGGWHKDEYGLGFINWKNI